MCNFKSTHARYFGSLFPARTFCTDMKFFQNFTLPDFQAKNFTPQIIGRSTVLEIKSGWNVLCTFICIVNRVVSSETYTTGKKFTLPPAVTAWTNLTSALVLPSMPSVCPPARKIFFFSFSFCHLPNSIQKGVLVLEIGLEQASILKV